MKTEEMELKTWAQGLVYHHQINHLTTLSLFPHVKNDCGDCWLPQTISVGMSQYLIEKPLLN